MDIKEEIDEIISGAGVSSYSIIFSRILNSILASLIIGIIGAGAYGIIGSIRRSSTIMRHLCGGITSGLNRTVPRLDPKEKNTVIIFAFVYSFIQVSLLLLIVFEFQDLVIEYTFISDDQRHIIKIGLYLLFISNFLSVTTEVLKSYKKIPEANLLQKWILPVIQILLVYIISLFASNTVVSVLYSLIIAIVLATFFGLYLIYTRTEFLSGEISRNMKPVFGFISFVLFLTLGGIFTTAQYSAPNILMFSIPKLQAGAFSIGLIIGGITRIPLASINQIFPQVATELYKKDRKDKINALFKSTSKIACFFSIPVFISSTVYHKEIAFLFSEEYVQYSLIIPSILVGQLIAVSIGTVGLLIIMTDNQKSNILLQLIISSISLSVLVPLTFEYGIFGLSIGYGFTLTINNIIELIFLYHRERLWSITKDHIGMVLSAFICVFILVGIKQITSIYISLILSSLFVSFMMYSNYQYFLKEQEKNAIHNYKKRFVRNIQQKIN